MTMRALLPPLRLIGARLVAPRPDRAVATPPGRARRPAGGLPPLRPRVEIPVCDPGPDAARSAALRARGQFLARQEDWERLSQEIGAADRARRLTPGLHSEAALLSEGARQDIAEAVSIAVQQDAPGTVATVLAALGAVQEDLPDCPAIANVLARAHVDAARAWCGDAQPEDLPDTRRASYAGHMAAAADLTDRFDPFEHDSPLWAQVRCAVLEADARPHERVADDYEDLIDLDPGNPRHLWALGHDLRPRRYGSWELLDRQARRTAARTADVWGSGGYTWVCFGALRVDPAAFHRLDAELFVEGLHDILQRHPTQDMANRLAAFTGFTLGGPSAAGSTRRRLTDCLGWITQDHLRELHPEIWAEAPLPCHPGRKSEEDMDPLRRGRARALASLADFYAPALEAGRRLIFDADGLRMVKDG